MNDIERLNLLSNLLKEAKKNNYNSMWSLANGIESLCSSIDEPSESFVKCSHQLWDTLEIIGYKAYEEGLPITDREISDLNIMTNSLLTLVSLEVEKRING